MEPSENPSVPANKRLFDKRQFFSEGGQDLADVRACVPHLDFFLGKIALNMVFGGGGIIATILIPFIQLINGLLAHFHNAFNPPFPDVRPTLELRSLNP